MSRCATAELSGAGRIVAGLENSIAEASIGGVEVVREVVPHNARIWWEFVGMPLLRCSEDHVVEGRRKEGKDGG